MLGLRGKMKEKIPFERRRLNGLSARKSSKSLVLCSDVRGG